jgi:hypothetical protein
MNSTHKLLTGAATWAIASIAIWLAASSWMSVSTYVWTNGLAVALGLVVMKTLWSGRPTRSIAHVIYDAESRTSTAR